MLLWKLVLYTLWIPWRKQSGAKQLVCFCSWSFLGQIQKINDAGTEGTQGPGYLWGFGLQVFMEVCYSDSRAWAIKVLQILSDLCQINWLVYMPQSWCMERSSPTHCLYTSSWFLEQMQAPEKSHGGFPEGSLCVDTHAQNLCMTETTPTENSL